MSRRNGMDRREAVRWMLSAVASAFGAVSFGTSPSVEAFRISLTVVAVSSTTGVSETSEPG